MNYEDNDEYVPYKWNIPPTPKNPPRKFTAGDFLHLEDRIEQLQLHIRNTIIFAVASVAINTALIVLLFLK